MAYLGLMPSEHSTGGKIKRGTITKAGNRRARQTVVECTWTYWFPPRLAMSKQATVGGDGARGA